MHHLSLLLLAFLPSASFAFSDVVTSPLDAAQHLVRRGGEKRLRDKEPGDEDSPDGRGHQYHRDPDTQAQELMTGETGSGRVQQIIGNPANSRWRFPKKIVETQTEQETNEAGVQAEPLTKEMSVHAGHETKEVGVQAGTTLANMPHALSLATVHGLHGLGSADSAPRMQVERRVWLFQLARSNWAANKALLQGWWDTQGKAEHKQRHLRLYKSKNERTIERIRQRFRTCARPGVEQFVEVAAEQRSQRVHTGNVDRGGVWKAVRPARGIIMHCCDDVKDGILEEAAPGNPVAARVLHYDYRAPFTQESLTKVLRHQHVGKPWTVEEILNELEQTAMAPVQNHLHEMHWADSDKGKLAAEALVAGAAPYIMAIEAHPTTGLNLLRPLVRPAEPMESFAERQIAYEYAATFYRAATQNAVRQIPHDFGKPVNWRLCVLPMLPPSLKGKVAPLQYVVHYPPQVPGQLPGVSRLGRSPSA